MRDEERKGTLAGLSCYVLWGLFPLYWKLLSEVDSLEIIAHRVIWCFATTMVVCAIRRREFRGLFAEPRAWRHLAPAGIIMTLNWGIYIYAINSGHVVEGSIGYYLNPLVSILLGLVVFHERLSKLRWAAVALCAIGIAYLTLDYGKFPWIAVMLAVTFAVYGAVKKHGGYPSVQALAFENVVMVGPAILFALVLANVTGQHAFLGDTASVHGWQITALLIIGGPVTALPLILFARAANSIPLTMLGFMQYVNPTLQLLCGAVIFGEPFTTAHAVCLGCIWAGIALVTIDTFLKSRDA